MEKKILKDLYCFQCSLQFDKKSIYDMHLSVMHNYVSKTESFSTKIKQERDDNELQIESHINSTKYGRVANHEKHFFCFISNAL